MSILNVNTIQPVGSGQTITVSAANISAPSTVVTASSFVGPLTGNVTGIVTSSSGNLTISNGNLVFSTAGTGIDFSATPNSSGTMTSELFNDYEEGTWTPTFGNLTVSSPTATYTKIGRYVYCLVTFTPSDAGTWSAQNYFTVTNLPFSPASQAMGTSIFSMGATQQAHFMGSGSSTIYFVCTATAASVNKNIFAPLFLVYSV